MQIRYRTFTDRDTAREQTQQVDRRLVRLHYALGVETAWTDGHSRDFRRYTATCRAHMVFVNTTEVRRFWERMNWTRIFEISLTNFHHKSFVQLYSESPNEPCTRTGKFPLTVSLHQDTFYYDTFQQLHPRDKRNSPREEKVKAILVNKRASLPVYIPSSVTSSHPIPFLLLLSRGKKNSEGRERSVVPARNCFTSYIGE